MLGGSLSAGDLTLLTPNIRSPGVITTASSEPMKNTLDSLNSKAAAATIGDNSKIPPGLANHDAHRKAHRDAKEKGEEWYVRLTIEASAEELMDDGNVLGSCWAASSASMNMTWSNHRQVHPT